MIDVNPTWLDSEFYELVTLNLLIVTRRCAPCVTNQHHTIVFYEEPQSSVDVGGSGHPIECTQFYQVADQAQHRERS